MHSVFFGGEFPSILNKLLWQIFTPGGSKYQGFAGRERVGEVVLSHQLWCFPNVWETCTPLPPTRIINKSWYSRYSICSFCGPFKVRGGMGVPLTIWPWMTSHGQQEEAAKQGLEFFPSIAFLACLWCEANFVKYLLYSSSVARLNHLLWGMVR